MAEAVINQWAIKDFDTGLFAEEVEGGKIKWTNDLGRARLYSRSNYADGSLRNYAYNAGRPIQIGNIKPVRLRIILTETSE